MNISHYVNVVRNKSRLLKFGTGLSVITRTNDLMAAWADLGKLVFDHFEHQDIIDHPITLRHAADDGKTSTQITLQIVEESPSSFIVMVDQPPRVHVLFDLYDGLFQIRYYPEGMDNETGDTGQSLYEIGVDSDADPS